MNPPIVDHHREYDEAQEMRDLAKGTAEDIERLGAFDPTTHVVGDSYPTAIAERLEPGKYDTDEDLADQIEDAYESWREDFDVLDIRAEVSVTSEGLTVTSVTMVLGTGGPHVEVTLDPDTGEGRVTAYGWYRAHETTHPVDAGNHPLTMIAETIRDQIEGVNQ